MRLGSGKKKSKAATPAPSTRRTAHAGSHGAKVLTQQETQEIVVSGEVNSLVVDPTFDDVDEDMVNNPMSTQEITKFKEGENIGLILPAIAEYGFRLPWRVAHFHYFNERLEKILGYSIPDTIPKKQTCAHYEDKRKCSWCDMSRKLKNSRTRRDQDLGYELAWSLDIKVNWIDLAAVTDRRLPSPHQIPKTVFIILRDELKHATDVLKGSKSRGYKIEAGTAEAPFTGIGGNGLIPVYVKATGQLMKRRYPLVKLLPSKARNSDGTTRFNLTPDIIEAAYDLNSFVQAPPGQREVQNMVDALFSGDGFAPAEQEQGNVFDDLDDLAL
jgi:hypothetical protein